MDVVLSFGDILLRQSDIRTLDATKWINDSIIAFYLEFLETVKYATGNHPYKTAQIPSGLNILLSTPHIDRMTAAYDHLMLRFINPSIVHLAIHAKENPGQFIPHIPEAGNKEIVYFIPLNNSNEIDHSEAGSHWSLLIYVKSLNLFFHLDSFNRFNAKQAKLAAAVFSKVFQSDDDDIPLKKQHHTSPSNLIHLDVPQQQNGADCGLHVLLAIDTIAHHLVNHFAQKSSHHHSLSESHIELWATSLDISKMHLMREELKDLIYGLQYS